jgi:hypothetical protein
VSVKWEEVMPDEKERLVVETQALLAGVDGVFLESIETALKNARRDTAKAFDLVQRLEELLQAGERKK